MYVLLMMLFFIFLIPSINALTRVVIVNETMDDGSNFSLTGATINNAGDGMLELDAASDRASYRAIPNLSICACNLSIEFYYQVDTAVDGEALAFVKSQNATGDVTNGRVLMLGRSGTNLISNGIVGGDTILKPFDAAPFLYRLDMLANATFQIFLNGTMLRSFDAGSLLSNLTYIWFGISPSSTVNFRVDNLTVKNLSVNLSVAPDTTFPIVNTTFNTTSFFVNQVINFTGNATDETALSYGNITYNLSGILTKINFTLSGTSAQMSNKTKLTSAGVFNFTMYATDSSGNVKQNSTAIIVTQASINGTEFLNNTNPKINETINVTVNATSIVLLADCNFYDNQSLSNGAFTILNKSLSGTKDQCSQNYTIRLGRGNVINFSVVVNDVLGDINFSQQLVTVENTPPPITLVTNASDKTYNRNQTINWSCTDADNDVINSSVWFNGGEFTTSDFNITTNMTADGTYFLNVSCFDGFNYSRNNTAWNISLDTSTPTYSTGLPANGTAYNIDRNITVTCDDSNIFELNTSVYNVSNGRLLFSNTTTNLTPTFTSYSSNFTINISWTDGSLNVTTWCGDTKNRKRPMDEWKVAKSIDNRSLQFNHSSTNLQCNITYGTTNPSENKLLPLASNVSLKMSIAYTNNDFYKINYDVVAPNTGFISATEFKCNQKIIQVYDNLAGHLLLGTGKERLSYDAQDLIDSGFTVGTKISTDNTFIQIIKKSGIVEGAVVSYDPRADNLNFLEISNIQVVDTIVPSITQVFGTNDSYYTTSTIIFNFTATDTGNSGVRAGTADLYANFSGTQILNQSKMNWNSTIKQGFNITTAIPDGHYVVWMLVNDTAGNFANTTNITIQVDGNPPVIEFNASQIGNNTNISLSSITINVTVNETFFRNITYSLFNGTDKAFLRNNTYTAKITNTTFSGLADGVYYYNATVYDIGNLSSSTDTRNLTIDSTSPTITLESPINNTVITAGEKPNVNFRISSNEVVKNCSLFLSGSLVGNESTQKQSHNFTVDSIDAGIHKWNATCYDIFNNFGASSAFKLEIGIISGGSGSIPEPAGGGGGGISPPINKIENESVITNKGYTMIYICKTVKKFLNGTPNYDLNSIVLLQEDIRFEIDFVIPFTTLKNYVDDYEQFCGVKIETKEIKAENKTQQSSASTVADQFSKFVKFNWMTYIKLPFQVDFGKLGTYGKNDVGLFDFANIFLPLSVSDEFSENPNVIWKGGIRIFPTSMIIVIIVVIVVAIKLAHSKRKLDLLSSVESLKKEEKKS